MTISVLFLKSLNKVRFHTDVTQQTFSCYKSAIGTLANGMKIAQRKKKKHQNYIIDIVLLSLLVTLTKLHTLLWCFHRQFWKAKK